MITCNVTYYNEPIWLRWWYKTFKRLHEDGVPFILAIGDDGSQREPAEEFFNKHLPLPNMKLFRVTEDIGFNSHGTRNLLMKQTTTEWNMLSDIDRHYGYDMFKYLTDNVATFKAQHYYSFKEKIVASPDGYSVNEYLVRKNDFWKTGGYDEEFVNIHWGDRLFLDTLRRVSKRVLLPEHCFVKYVRKSREVIWDNVEKTIYPDDFTLIHPNDRWPDQDFRFDLKKRIAARNKIPEERLAKKVINFEWEQVF